MRTRRDGGAATVEFALIAPVVFALVFGLLWVGLYATWGAFAERAARIGARFAAMKTYSTYSSCPVLGYVCDVTNDVAVDPTTGLVQVLDMSSLTSTTTSLTSDPGAFVGDPLATISCPAEDPYWPYPNEGDIVAAITKGGYSFVGPPTDLQAPADPSGVCPPNEGDEVTVVVTYKVPGVSQLLGVLGLGPNAGTVTRSATARRE